MFFSSFFGEGKGENRKGDTFGGESEHLRNVREAAL